MAGMRKRNLIVRLVPHLVAAAAIVLCIQLALWQSDRAGFKQTLLEEWSDAPVVELGSTTDIPDQFSHVRAFGHFDSERHILLDNQIRATHPGVHVFTLFSPQGSDRIWLVNRGWQPYDRRNGRHADFSTPEQPLTINGRISDPPRVGVQIGQAQALSPDNWPNLMTYFDLELIRDALGDQVASRIILLDPDHPAHLTGDAWQPVIMGPERHRAYAFQWWAMASAIFLIWLVLTIRNMRAS